MTSPNLKRNSCKTILPTDLSISRLDDLETHLEQVQLQADNLDFDLPGAYCQIETELEERLREAQRYGDRFEQLKQQDATSAQISREYYPFLNEMDGISQRLEELQRALVYLTVNNWQQPEYGSRLTHTEEVCSEVDDRLAVDGEYLPVVWAEYGSYPIQYCQFYAIHLPRDNNAIQNSPILAHELGHTIVDQMREDKHAKLRKYIDVLQNWASDFKRRNQDLIISSWRNWFAELVCDACGVLTFGPAYIITLVRRLQSANPYRLVSRGSAREHPPDDIRYRFTKDLLRESVSQEMYELTEGARERYEDHLERLAGHKRAGYSSWTNEKLLTLVVEATKEYLEPDLDRLCSSILDGGSEASVRQRTEANRELLNV